MRRFITLVAMPAFAGTANAAVIDQDSFPSPPFGIATVSSGGVRNAQTFTVGIAGRVVGFEVESRVSFEVESRSAALIASGEGRLLPTVAGVPSVASPFLAIDNGGDLRGSVVRFDFGTSGPLVAVGDVLAWEVFAPDNGFVYANTSAVAYALGSTFFTIPAFGVFEFEFVDSDFAFRTFIDAGSPVPAPSPAAVALFGLGALALGLRRCA